MRESRMITDTERKISFNDILQNFLKIFDLILVEGLKNLEIKIGF